MSRSWSQSKTPSRPLNLTQHKVDTESFTFLSPFSNLDLYPDMNHPPYLDMRRCPTMLDVIKARQYLFQKLPAEVIDVIMDLAEYWPHTSSILDMTTRVYHEHMRYGSHGRGPKTRCHNRSSTSQLRREMPGFGFVLRTPPLGLRCVQSDDPRRGYVRSLLSTSSQVVNKGVEETPDWLPPRGKHPARAICFEILSREERPTDHSMARGFRSDSKTSLEASIDSIKLLKAKSSPSQQPLHWTTEAATTMKNTENPLDSTQRDFQYTFQPRLIPITHPGLPKSIPITWNRTAQNRKCVVTYKYDDTIPHSIEKERYLSDDNARGFVRSLKEGDSIVLWAKAYEGAGPVCNVVDRVKIHVFWAV